MMGGIGRTFDDVYAEYTCVPAEQVIPFTSNLGWATLGAVPESDRRRPPDRRPPLGRPAVRQIRRDGVDVAIELVGTPTLATPCAPRGSTASSRSRRRDSVGSSS
jgi:hypothetical protein